MDQTICGMYMYVRIYVLVITNYTMVVRVVMHRYNDRDNSDK